MVKSKADYLVAAMWLNLVGVAAVAAIWFGSQSALRAGIVGAIFYTAVMALWIKDNLDREDEEG